MSNDTLTNQQIAEVLDQIAELLEAKDENTYRIRAYQQAASAIRDYMNPISKIYKTGGKEKLVSLAGIGEVIAKILEDIIITGKTPLLQQLQGEVTPVDLFSQVPGIGKVFSQRIVDQLDIHSLAELQLAAHDGRLNQVDGFGKHRVDAVKTSLASMLRSSTQHHLGKSMHEEVQINQIPPISLLLEVDKEYRQKSEAGELKMIAPKRFNPDNKAWLPIMHTEKQGWYFTVLFSNTKRAHDLGKTNDWVVIYYKKNDEEKQSTVVTESNGILKDKRVVRGREAESREYYKDV